ncbi:uncharacterized protein LOC6565663 [Drosophila grimshawi]|uniref:GH24268 n=1 Tax=Drosophila grimshawi TaxID=7222 RepID=B4JMU3_DROGR|nr:uncharacterized protein LOC6565663 [Drosophila grimshawi]EDV92036.1 GH24268 [Drosophila grimshawi]
MKRSAYEVQRDFALSSGFHSEIIWDSLAPEQPDVLRQKIANLICQMEDEDEDVATTGRTRSNKLLAKQRQHLFENVWKQRTYTNRTLLSAIIYVLVTPETDATLALQSTNYSCHPVIRTRKCVRADGGGNESSSDGCCMIFIDEHGRVYANWQRYVRNNALPRGTMIAPHNGVYTFTKLTDQEREQVQLMVLSTPASWLKQKMLQVSDKLVTVGGIVATVPVAATLALPVAAPILIAATVVGVSTAAYSTVRSASRLIDRRWHGQTVSLADNEARSSWLGVAGGVAGLGATSANTALSVLRAGRAGRTAQLAVHGCNVSSMVIAGTGVVSGVYDLYLKISDEQSLSGYDAMQMASSLLIFTHSVNNLRLAVKATNGHSLRRVVRHQTRKVFSRISEESAKLHSSDTSRKLDIVRLINDIPYKEVLLNLHKIHSHLAAGATVALVLDAVGAAGVQLPTFVRLAAGGGLSLDLPALASQLGCKFVGQIGSLTSFMDVLDGMSRYFSEQAMQLLLQLTRTFVEQSVDGIDRTLNTFVSTELVLYRMLMHCINNYENCAVDFLEQHRHDILAVIGKYFKSLQPQPEPEQKCIRRKCPACHGVFYMSRL